MKEGRKEGKKKDRKRKKDKEWGAHGNLGQYEKTWM